MDEQEQKHKPGTPGVWKAPNFGLIVILFAVAIVLILAISSFFLRLENGHIERRRDRHAVSE